MPSISRALVVLVLAATLPPLTVLAQPSPSDRAEARYAPPVAQATRIATAPALDGDVLNDPAWAALPAIERFWQTTPDEGDPATERTVVKVAFDDQYFYVGVVCYHQDAHQIIVSDARRDGDLQGIDSFQFVLDTYMDTQNGFVFGTSPAGIEYDAQIANEGSGQFGFTGQQAGSMGGLNVNWDGAWDVSTEMGDYGWSAEFAIPFRTLRFPKKAVQSWGVNFQRTIRHNNEIAYWSKLPRQFNLYRVSRAGTLEGLEVPNPRNLKIMPYVLGQTSVDRIGDAGGNMGDFGVDAKYSLTPSMALDLTYNTDFAQVEVDEQQINLDRFSLFFPEKRPFFLENAGLFSINSDGTAQTGSDVELFFSRRIGIGSEGETVPIIGGARMSGSIGRTSVGFLNMQTEALEGVTESNNFGVARVEQKLKNRSSVGFMLVNREGRTSLASGIDNPYNRLLAVDGKVGIGENTEVTAYVARTFSPHLDGAQHAFDVSAQRNTEAFLLTLQYSEVADEFNPEVGFLARQSYRKINGLVFNRIRPDDLLGLLEIRPHVNYRGYWGFTDGFQETGYLHVDSHWEWRSGIEIHTGMNVRKEGVREDFELGGVAVPADTYNWAETQLVFMTNESKKVSLEERVNAGGFFGGSRLSSTTTLRLRIGNRFNSEFALQRNDVSLPAGDFTSNLLRTRLSYAFTPRIFLQSLLQYNDQAEVWSANVRFGWLQSSNTGLFLVFNQASGLDLANDDYLLYGFGDLINRSLTLKYTHLIDVFK
ncbi:MAG: DUF5916 domain-containing protein [Rhodothermales bacterium]